jgi:hypothetical protein
MQGTRRTREEYTSVLLWGTHVYYGTRGTASEALPVTATPCDTASKAARTTTSVLGVYLQNPTAEHSAAPVPPYPHAPALLLHVPQHPDQRPPQWPTHERLQHGRAGRRCTARGVAADQAPLKCDHRLAASPSVRVGQTVDQALDTCVTDGVRKE